MCCQQVHGHLLQTVRLQSSDGKQSATECAAPEPSSRESPATITQPRTCPTAVSQSHARLPRFGCALADHVLHDPCRLQCSLGGNLQAERSPGSANELASLLLRHRLIVVQSMVGPMRCPADHDTVDIMHRNAQCPAVRVLLYTRNAIANVSFP